MKMKGKRVWLLNYVKSVELKGVIKWLLFDRWLKLIESDWLC